VKFLISIAMAIAFVAAAPAVAPAAKIERIVTPGGIEIWHVRDETLPMVSMEFGFLGGSAQDPADKSGLATMMAALLDEGAGDLDARAFKEQLEERAIELSFSAQRDTMRGSLKSLSEHRDRAFDLLNLALTKPRFDESAIERIRAAMLAGIRRRATDPNQVGGERWFARAFPDHPYGRPQRGNLESVAGITADDLRSAHRNLYARSNLKVATIGAIEADEIAKLVDRGFAGLPEEPNLTPVADIVPQGNGEHDIVEMDVPQTVITFGGLGLKRSDPDFVPAFVLNHILGGGSFSSRLYREVREKRGLAYSVYSTLSPLRHAGLFIGGVSTRNERAAESLSIILEQIRELAESGPTEDELAKTKSFLVGSFPLRFDTSAKIAQQLLEIQIEDLGIDYIDRRNDLIRAVTADDVRRAAGRFLTEASLLVTLVGRPDPVPATDRPLAPANRG
jgi:zinc protease